MTLKRFIIIFYVFIMKVQAIFRIYQIYLAFQSIGTNFAERKHKTQFDDMERNEPIRKFTREDILALLARGREIKERRQKEAEEWYAERQRRKKEAAESGYYDIEWN